MKLNGQDVKELRSTESVSSESIDSFELSDELANKVLSEKGQTVSHDTHYTIDTKRGALLGVSGKEESYLAKADKTWRGFTELGNFAEVREVYKARIELGKSIYMWLCIILVLLFILAIFFLIWLEVTYGA